MTLKRNSITESEDDQIERETFSGKRSIDDLKQMMRCRDRAEAMNSLMVPRNRFLPGLRPDDHSVPQQGSRVLVEERLCIARYVEAPAPREHVILHRLDVF